MQDEYPPEYSEAKAVDSTYLNRYFRNRCVYTRTMNWSKKLNSLALGDCYHTN